MNNQRSQISDKNYNEAYNKSKTKWVTHKVKIYGSIISYDCYIVTCERFHYGM